MPDNSVYRILNEAQIQRLDRAGFVVVRKDEVDSRRRARASAAPAPDSITSSPGQIAGPSGLSPADAANIAPRVNTGAVRAVKDGEGRVEMRTADGQPTLGDEAGTGRRPSGGMERDKGVTVSDSRAAADSRPGHETAKRPARRATDPTG